MHLFTVIEFRISVESCIWLMWEINGKRGFIWICFRLHLYLELISLLRLHALYRFIISCFTSSLLSIYLAIYHNDKYTLIPHIQHSKYWPGHFYFHFSNKKFDFPSNFLKFSISQFLKSSNFLKIYQSKANYLDFTRSINKIS